MASLIAVRRIAEPEPGNSGGLGLAWRGTVRAGSRGVVSHQSRPSGRDDQ
jgi:hypothetical protein